MMTSGYASRGGTAADAGEKSESGTGPNAIPSLRRRARAGQLKWFGPAIMLLLIGTLAALVSIGLRTYFTATSNPRPDETVIALINIWNTLLYVPALLVLRVPVRGEGMDLQDLIGFDRAKLGRDLLLGIGLCFGLFALDAAVEFTISRAIFGIFGDPFAGRSFTGFSRPSVAAVAFGLVGVPLGAGIVEEMVYRGYALPRLIALSNRWIGLLLMAAGFGWQHVGLALAADWRVAVERGLSLAEVGVVMGVIYLRQRRLVPLIIGHTLWDFLAIGVLSGVLPFLLARG